MTLTTLLPLVRNIVRVGSGIIIGTGVTPQQVIETATGLTETPGTNTAQVAAGILAWVLVEVWYAFARSRGWKT